MMVTQILFISLVLWIYICTYSKIIKNISQANEIKTKIVYYFLGFVCTISLVVLVYIRLRIFLITN